MPSSKTKLLFITYTHSNGGGAEHVLTTFVNALSPEKYSITIQEIDHFNVKKEPLNSSIRFNHPLHDSALFSKPFNLLNYYLLKNYPKVLKATFNWNNYDAVITWNYQLPSFALTAFTKEKKIGWFHGAIDDLIVDLNSTEETIEKHIMQHTAWVAADKIVTISNQSKKSLEKAFPEFLEKCFIISNPVPIDEILDKSNADTDVKIPQTGHNLISIGRLDSNKNNALAINALNYILEIIPDTMLYLVGTGYEKENLEKLINEKKLTDHVVFLGYQQNPYPILKQCDILCMTSFSEGFPTVVCEAMALKKTFVTTPVAGASEELSKNNTCGLVADWNEEDYADKVIQIFSDKEKYNTLCENAYKNVQNFTVEAAVAKFEKLLDSIQDKEKANKTSSFSKLKYLFLFSVNTGNFYNIKNRILYSKKRLNTAKNLKNLIKLCWHLFTFALSITFVPILFIPKFLFSMVYILKLDKD